MVVYKIWSKRQGKRAKKKRENQAHAAAALAQIEERRLAEGRGAGGAPLTRAATCALSVERAMEKAVETVARPVVDAAALACDGVSPARPGLTPRIS